MKNVLFISILVFCISNYAKSQIQVNQDGHVSVGTVTNGYGILNVYPQYTSPGATNLIIGDWNNTTNGLMSLGVNQDYSWIQSFNSKPMHINRIGGHTIFGSESYECVGIGRGMITPSAQLHVLGAILATGTITSSDGRLKKNINEIGSMDLICKELKPVSYNFDIQNMGVKMEGIDTSKVSKIDKEFYT